MKRLTLLISFLLITSTLHAQTYTVERIVYGDTLKLTNGERVRLIGIDCPESKDNAKARRDAERTGKDVETIIRMGRESYEFVRRWLLEGEQIILKFDVQRKDKYGRLLAYVFHRWDITDIILDFVHIEGVHEYVEEDGKQFIDTFVNASIVYEGYASPMTIPPNVKHAEVFKKLYEEARQNNRGLWRDDSENIEAVNYEALEKVCKQKGGGCCMASLKAMRKNNYFLASEDDSINYGCPEGYRRNGMLCIDSFQWCEPIK